MKINYSRFFLLLFEKRKRKKTRQLSSFYWQRWFLYVKLVAEFYTMCVSSLCTIEEGKKKFSIWAQ